MIDDTLGVLLDAIGMAGAKQFPGKLIDQSN